MSSKKGLGRGLGALMGDSAISAITEEKPQLEISINLIDVNKEQARKRFDEEKIAELAESIRQHGIIQPLILRKHGERYTIVAGERRYRAARKLKLKTVPAVIRDIDEDKLLELSIIENIQREDLSPIEEAHAISLLMDEHGYTQETVSERIGRSRSAVANTLRLLTLPEGIKQLVNDGTLSAGHARALIPLKTNGGIEEAAAKVIEKEMSVRETEAYIKKLLEKKPEKRAEERAPEFKEAESRMSEKLSTKVKISGGKERGRITIEYYSAEQLDELYEMLS